MKGMEISQKTRRRRNTVRVLDFKLEFGLGKRLKGKGFSFLFSPKPHK